MLPSDALIPIALFMALLLAASLHGLAASGHFPRAHHAPRPASSLMPIILFGSIALVFASFAAGIAAAARLIPWYAAIIGGGLAVLAAPPVLQRFPDRFVDGRGALVAFATISAVLALLLIWIATER